MGEMGTIQIRPQTTMSFIVRVRSKGSPLFCFVATAESVAFSPLLSRIDKRAAFPGSTIVADGMPPVTAATDSGAFAGTPAVAFTLLPMKNTSILTGRFPRPRRGPLRYWLRTVGRLRRRTHSVSTLGIRRRRTRFFGSSDAWVP